MKDGPVNGAKDRDQVHVLPLDIIPLEAKALQKTRMLKNTHLETVLELYQDSSAGSGQIEIGQLRTVFNEVGMSDISVLQKLSRLHSYDVYSLRRVLRDLEIPVKGDENLELSQEKQDELNNYMRMFTRPLIMHIYGDHDVKPDTAEDILSLFRDPDTEKALTNLKAFARLLHIQVHEVPDFLPDMGDLFMSISYYREYMDRIGPILVNFNASVEEIKDNRQLQQDRSLIQNCEMVQHRMRTLAANVVKRFRAFETMNNDMWDSVRSENFNLMGKTISGSQTEMGGALCTLTVKMMAWSQRFPDRHMGGPNKWADFILTDMRQGLGQGK